jgi:hypothetical protein
MTNGSASIAKSRLGVVAGSVRVIDKSSRRSRSQVACLAASADAMYSASVVDRATVGWRQLFQAMCQRLDPTKSLTRTKPDDSAPKFAQTRRNSTNCETPALRQPRTFQDNEILLFLKDNKRHAKRDAYCSLTDPLDAYCSLTDPLDAYCSLIDLTELQDIEPYCSSETIDDTR